jgi:hypothetical protein
VPGLDDGDARAYGACFTADCDYVSYDGTWQRGREPMVASHDKLFRGVLFGSVLVAWRTRLPKRRRTRNTIVAVRTPDGWRFTAIHNGRIRPVGVPEPDSLPAEVARGLVGATGALGMGRARADRPRVPTPSS